MRRWAALVPGPFLAFGGMVGMADASGAAVCTITGTIAFSPSESLPAEGTYRIQPAVITCQGIFRSFERITGPGEFSGSGTYAAAPGSDGCLVHAGSGDVDYRLQTSDNDVHISEAHEFVLAGAGAFFTPSLNGSFQIAPPYDGDCVTEPLTRAGFVAQGALARINGIGRG